MATTRRVRVVVTALETFIESIIKKITLDIVANLTAAPSEGGTPVDTGWARANWVPQIGTAPTGTVGSPANVTGAPQHAGAVAVAAGYKLDKGPVFISNNVPYILKLNAGSSQQAPKGFIQAAIAKAIRVDLGATFGL